MPYLCDRENDRERHIFRADKTQKSFDGLNEKCTELGLKINDKKTQLLTISSAKK